MFGYVIADRSSLTEDQLRRYQSCYCGLCQCIGTHYGTLQRMALNYDLTFLSLLLSALYEPEETHTTARCPVHPFRRHPRWQTPATEYAAAMTMALVYHSKKDDWSDDRDFGALMQTAVFRRSAAQVAEIYPRQWAAITDGLYQLSEIEQRNLQEPDLPANVFGSILGELFLWKEDHWSNDLRRMGEALGRYIYLLDALLDLPADRRRGSYNPLISRAEAGTRKADYLPILKLYLGECTDHFEHLPILQDLDLLRNILYSGVWTRFYENDRQSGKEEHHV